MKTTEFFSSKFLTAADLKGKEHKLVIDHVDAQKFQDNTVKPAMYFRNREKGIILNKTNAMKIAANYGEDMESWAGKEVILYPEKVPFNNSMVDAIRLRVVLPQAAAEGPNDDIPF